jgi:hypothetical protein
MTTHIPRNHHRLQPNEMTGLDLDACLNSWTAVEPGLARFSSYRELEDHFILGAASPAKDPALSSLARLVWAHDMDAFALACGAFALRLTAIADAIEARHGLGRQAARDLVARSFYEVMRAAAPDGTPSGAALCSRTWAHAFHAAQGGSVLRAEWSALIARIWRGSPDLLLVAWCRRALDRVCDRLAPLPAVSLRLSSHATKGLDDWADEAGLPRCAVRWQARRLASGWSAYLRCSLDLRARILDEIVRQAHDRAGEPCE